MSGHPLYFILMIIPFYLHQKKMCVVVFTLNNKEIKLFTEEKTHCRKWVLSWSAGVWSQGISLVLKELLLNVRHYGRLNIAYTLQMLQRITTFLFLPYQLITIPLWEKNHIYERCAASLSAPGKWFAIKRSVFRQFSSMCFRRLCIMRWSPLGVGRR